MDWCLDTLLFLILEECPCISLQHSLHIVLLLLDSFSVKLNEVKM